MSNFIERPEEVRKALTKQFARTVVGVAYFSEKPSIKELDDIRAKLRTIGKMATIESSGLFGWTYLFIDSYTVKDLPVTGLIRHLLRNIKIAVFGNIVKAV